MNVDLSASAITKRLRQTSALRKLCVSLGGARLKEKTQKGLKSKNSVAIANPQ